MILLAHQPARRRVSPTVEAPRVRMQDGVPPGRAAYESIRSETMIAMRGIMAAAIARRRYG